MNWQIALLTCTLAPSVIACGSEAPQPSSAIASKAHSPNATSTASASPIAVASGAMGAPDPSLDRAPDRSTGWVWTGPDPGSKTSFVHGRIAIDTKEGMCRFVYDDLHKSTSVECFLKGDPKRLWGYDEGGGFVEDAALAADDDNLYVARYSNISSGCAIIAYVLSSGEERWRMNIVGLGPIDHSEYLNSVEMRIGRAPNTLEVFGWESAGRYIETIDKTAGATNSTRRIDSAGVTDVPAPPTPTTTEPPHPGEAINYQFAFGKQRPAYAINQKSKAALPKKSCALSFDDKNNRESLACNDGSGKRLWGFDLANTFVAAGSLVGDDKAIYVLSYCAISSGAVVTSYDSATGQVRWEKALYAIGPIDHSKYSNVAVLHLERGRIVASGWESSGKYVEVLNPLTGEDLGNRTEP